MQNNLEVVHPDFMKVPGTPDQLEARRELLWALRSGRFKQTSGRLKFKDGGFCCLGVACEISKFGFWHEANEFGSVSFFLNGTDPIGDPNNCNISILPVELMDYFGLYEGMSTGMGRQGFLPRGWWVDGRAFRTLTELNDSANLTFSQIADAFEANYEV